MRQNIKKLVLLLCLLLLIVILVHLSGVVKTKNYSDKNAPAALVRLNFESRIDKLKSFTSEEFYKFGWIQVQGTNIDAPILDNLSGLETDMDYSYGWMSPNYITGENRPVIMGHNILNVSNEPMLPNESLRDFEALMAFSYYGFAKDNLYIEYTTEDSDAIYLIYAIGFYDYNYDQSQSFKNKKDVAKYIENARKNSIYDYDIDVNGDDEIITIKTCTRYFGDDSKQQFVIEARKLRENEKAVKYKVDTTKNYEKLNLKKENM